MDNVTNRSAERTTFVLGGMIAWDRFRA